MMRKPDFFIIGAPKSGTTALYRTLEQHPDIFVPSLKELHHFGTDLYSPTYLRDTGKYLSLFSAARHQKRIGEASVWYLYSKRSAQEIKSFSPQASIIMILRSPIDMIYSLHSHYLYIGTEDIENFEEALNAEATRKQGLRLPKNLNLTEGLFYRDVGKYAAQVERYQNAFAPERVKVIIYDDFKADPVKTYRDTFEFLGVNPDFKPQNKVVNANKRVRSKTARQLLESPPSRLKSLAQPLTSPLLRHKLYKALTRLNTRYQARPSLSEALRERLGAEFAADIQRLSGLLDRDLNYWCQRPPESTHGPG